MKGRLHHQDAPTYAGKGRAKEDHVDHSEEQTYGKLQREDTGETQGYCLDGMFVVLRTSLYYFPFTHGLTYQQMNAESARRAEWR